MHVDGIHGILSENKVNSCGRGQLILGMCHNVKFDEYNLINVSIMQHIDHTFLPTVNEQLLCF